MGGTPVTFDPSTFKSLGQPAQAAPQAAANGVTFDHSTFKPLTQGAAPPAAGQAPATPDVDQYGNKYSTGDTERDQFASVTGFETPANPAAAVGFAKSAAQTATAIPRLIAPQTVEKYVPAASIKPTGAGEQFGAGVEQVAEWLAGEAGVKAGLGALGLAEKYKWYAEAAKFIEKNPKTAALVQNAIAGAAQAKAHGATNAEAARTGAVTGVVGAAGEGVSGWLSKRLATLGTAAEKVNVLGQETRVGSRAVSQPETNTAMRGGLEEAVNQTEPRTMTQYPDETPVSIRDIFKDAGEVKINDAKASYDQVDKAVVAQGKPGLKALSDQLNKLEMQERVTWTDEGLAKLEEQRVAIEQGMEGIKKQYPEVAAQLDAANATWKQGMALRDVQKAVDMSTQGIRPEWVPTIPGAREALRKESIDPAKLEPRLQKLFSSGRLQQAFGGGEEGADRAANVVALADLMKRDTQFSRDLERHLVLAVLAHPVKGIISGVKGIWESVLDSPAATNAAIAAFKAFKVGKFDPRMAPAILNALQIHAIKDQNGNTVAHKSTQ